MKLNLLAFTCLFLQVFCANALNGQRNLDGKSWVLLANGQVLTGEVSRSESSTQLQLQNGANVRLRNEQVSFIGKSMEEVYLYQRARKVRVRASEYLELADWCFNHKLLKHAETHVQQAMELSPNDPATQVRLRRLELLQSQLDVPDVNQTLPTPSASKDLQVDVERIIKSLPAPTIQEFVRHVQPILLKNCSTARCHNSSGDYGFALIKPSFSNTIPQRYSRRNLISTLSVVNETEPLQSPLVKMALTSHADASLKPQIPLPETESSQWEHLKHWLLRFKVKEGKPKVDLPDDFSAAVPNLLMQRNELPQMPIPQAYQPADTNEKSVQDPFDAASFNLRR